MQKETKVFLNYFYVTFDFKIWKGSSAKGKGLQNLTIKSGCQTYLYMDNNYNRLEKKLIN